MTNTLHILMLAIFTVTLSSCGWIEGAGRSVEAVGDGAGHALEETGDAIGDAATKTEDSLEEAVD